MFKSFTVIVVSLFVAITAVPAHGQNKGFDEEMPPSHLYQGACHFCTSLANQGR